MNPGDSIQTKDSSLIFEKYAVVYGVECAIFRRRHDGITIMTRANADKYIHGGVLGIAGYTGLIMLRLPQMENPVQVERCTAAIFGMSPGSYTFALAWMDTFSGCISERMGFLPVDPRQVEQKGLVEQIKLVEQKVLVDQDVSIC